MNKSFLYIAIVIIVSVGGVVAITVFAFSSFAFPNANGEYTVVEKKPYGFRFAYPTATYPHVRDEWDNGLAGSQDGGVYGYRAESEYVGPYTQDVSVSVYRRTLDAYLTDNKTSQYTHKVKNIWRFGMFGKRDITVYGSPDTNLTGTVPDECVYLFEKNGLLYVVDCDVSHFELLPNNLEK